MVLRLNNLKFPSPKDTLHQIWLKLPNWFLKRRFFNSVNVFLLFGNYIPLETGWGLYVKKNKTKKLESSSPKNVLCKVWLKLAKLFRRIFLFYISLMYFHYLIIIPHWKRMGSFIWTNLNPLYCMMFCSKFGWNWPSGSREEYFQIPSMYFCNLVIIFRRKRASLFIWTNLNFLHPRMH